MVRNHFDCARADGDGAPANDQHLRWMTDVDDVLIQASVQNIPKGFELDHSDECLQYDDSTFAMVVSSRHQLRRDEITARPTFDRR
jgi:hypothetical protein